MENQNKKATEADTALLLRPCLSNRLKDFLGESKLIRDLVTAFGSPLNILFPQAMAGNHNPFLDMLAKHRVKGKLFFAHKANQSHSLLSETAMSTIGVDVASLDELRHALACGFTGARLEATGPKNLEFLHLCLMHGLVVNVDSMDELMQLVGLQSALAAPAAAQIPPAQIHPTQIAPTQIQPTQIPPARILLRLTDFKAPRNNVIAKQSRFGIRLGDLSAALAAVAQHRDKVELLGFAFHLDSISLDERVVAIENCLEAIEEAIDLGLEPHIINAGGHFRINYLQYEEDWHRYTSAIKQAALGTGPQVTWQNKYFGLSTVAGTLRGQFTTYGFFEPAPGAAFLEKLLESELPAYGHKKVAAVLRENMIELWLEPGRALLDQAGITLARVNSIKTASSGEILVNLNMKRSDIGYLDQEIFVDPILLDSASSGDQERVPVYLAGSLCLESDLIYRHLTYLPRLPKPGDILAFVNTAAYSMDFSASFTAGQPPAKRLAVCQNKDGFSWTQDELYTPIHQLITKE